MIGRLLCRVGRHDYEVIKRTFTKNILHCRRPRCHFMSESPRTD